MCGRAGVVCRLRTADGTPLMSALPSLPRAGAGGVTPPPPDLSPDEIVDMGIVSRAVVFFGVWHVKGTGSCGAPDAYDVKSEETMQSSSSGQTGWCR